MVKLEDDIGHVRIIESVAVNLFVNLLALSLNQAVFIKRGRVAFNVTIRINPLFPGRGQTEFQVPLYQGFCLFVPH